MTIKAVVFDIGGVLEYTPDQGRAEQKWAKILDFQPGEMWERMLHLWRRGEIGTCTEADVLDGLRDIMGMTPEQIEGYWADVWQDYLGDLNTELHTYFANLRPRYKTGILSNSFVGAREREQAAYGFEAITDTIVYSHEVGLKKPDPRIFQLLCDRLTLLPSEIVFLDDVEGHVMAARAFGIHAVQFLDNQQAISEIEALLQRT